VVVAMRVARDCLELGCSLGLHSLNSCNRPDVRERANRVGFLFVCFEFFLVFPFSVWI
jgi:hypothetical protein